MSLYKALQSVKLSRTLQRSVDEVLLPPIEGKLARKHQLVYEPIYKNTRSYIERICNQVNGCYEMGWYDACAVMIRRLLETLLIELFESRQIADKIKSNGDFMYLRDIINAALSEPSWNLGRNTKRGLAKLKDIGDKSAHSRMYNAMRPDIDNIKDDLRTVVQELFLLSGLKK